MKTVTMTPELRSAAQAALPFSNTQAGYAAQPYVRALLAMPDGATSFYEDSLHTVLSYLIGNLKGWRGEEAKAAKQVIRAALK